MLARTFLRMCALESLRPSSLLTASSPAWPTIANDYVFDSRLDPIDDMKTERQPVIVVYTEDDHQKRIAQAGPTFYTSTVDLVFEISVIAKWRDPSETGEEIGVAYSDAEVEASLDLLEAQIVHALHFGQTGTLFRKIGRVPFEGGWKSQVHRTSEEGGRLAMRTCTATLRLSDTCTNPAPTVTPTGFDRLPAPLQSIAEQLGDSTYIAKLALATANAAPVMPVAVPLKTVALDVDARTVNTPQDADSIVSAEADNLQGS